ncbi:MAG: T9SS type A sorting domain-containing protein [Bacteroidales bacterium]|nr:T9SS type A sorting domain-containing protein [Bacteroidales bacterium]
MKKISFLVLFSALFVSHAQNPSFSNIKFWTGTGEKVAMMIVDFNDGTTKDAYAWGYRYDSETLTAFDMLEAIAQADPNFNYEGSGGFISDIEYLSHSGIGGSPNWWLTSTFENNAWEMNSGVSENLTDSLVFGYSYTEWGDESNPLEHPDAIIGAKKPFITNTDEVVYWVGNGTKKAYLVIDFNDDATDECYIWGYKFESESLTFENMIADIANDDSHLTISMPGGFISDITYNDQSGIGGNPFYWSSFTLTNQLWEMNMGVSDPLEDNSMFGLSYTDWDEEFNPVSEPKNAVPASLHTQITNNNKLQVSIFPNPTSDILFIQDLKSDSQLSIYNSLGSLVYRTMTKTENTEINVSNFPNGNYVLKIENGVSNHRLIFVKQ